MGTAAGSGVEVGNSGVAARVKGAPVGWDESTAAGSGVGGRSVPVDWRGLASDGDGAVWLLPARHPVKAVKVTARERTSFSSRSWPVRILRLVLKVTSAKAAGLTNTETLPNKSSG